MPGPDSESIQVAPEDLRAAEPIRRAIVEAARAIEDARDRLRVAALDPVLNMATAVIDGEPAVVNGEALTVAEWTSEAARRLAHDLAETIGDILLEIDPSSRLATYVGEHREELARSIGRVK